MNRFDYVRYDEYAADKQLQFKDLMLHVEELIEVELPAGRAKALALTKLEELYMWVGKAIRDEQVERTGIVVLQEERGDG